MRDRSLEIKTGQRPGKLRRIVGDILIICVILFTAYLSAIMIHRINTVVLKSTYQKVFHYELFICAMLLLFTLDVRFGFFTKLKPIVLKIIGWVLRIIVILFTAAILLLIGKVIIGSVINTAMETENVIVLGMALQNGKPQEDLILRLDTAQKYLANHPDATLILTGGNPDNNGLTEAGVMRELLLKSGVPDESMVLEDQATTTVENFKNVAKMIDTDDTVVLISSDYHMDRAVRNAESAGFHNIKRLPAPSDPIRYGANVMWEVIMDIDDMTSGGKS